MEGLLSDDLKKRLRCGNDYEEEAIDIVLPAKAKKGKVKKKKVESKSKSKQKKEQQKLKDRTQRMKSKSEIDAERKVLLQKISSLQLPENTSLLSSKSLRRKPEKVRLPWDVLDQNAGSDHQDESEEEEDFIVPTKRTQLVPAELKVPEVLVAQKVKAENSDKGKESSMKDRPLPSRTARMLSSRPEEIIKSRKELPATQWEGQIMDTISEHDIVIVCGPTGSGKTTQIPQWIFEHGYREQGLICVTQPRKVAARMVSERVAYEMGVTHGKEVGYHVRHECVVQDYETCDILFVTDGLLLNVMLEDVLLSKYSCVIIDEAHERTLGTDVLLGMLSRVVPLRRKRWNEGHEIPPLKVVIMSATLSIEQLTTGLFKTVPPVISIEGRQYPVEVHWLRVTPTELIDSLEEAVKSISVIHRTLPQGTILAFVPGKREIFYIIRKLKEMFSEKDSKDNKLSIHVVPLHSGLEPKAQRIAFQPPPENSRMIVVATNVAECSLTLPDVRYVVDTGFSRERLWASDGDGVFSTKRISQASAAQRTGRAGRTMGGHCYRLYSQPFFHHHMEQHELPQSLKLPSEQLVLTLVTIGISYPGRFPLPSPPSIQSLKDAQLRLAQLGLLRSEIPPLKQTVLGFSASALPIEPAAARALLGLGKDWGCLEALAVATWAYGHSLWVGDKQGVWEPTWKDAVTCCDILRPCNAFYEMYQSPTNATKIRTALGIPSTAVQAVISLADQVMARSEKKDENVSNLLVQTKAPNNSQVLSLRMALLGGVPQFVMRKEGDHYVRLLDNGTVYLHPENCSKEFRAAGHQWISCLELQSPTESSKRYAVYPFAINPAWLHDVVQEGPELQAPKLLDYTRLDLSTVRYLEKEDAMSVDCSPRFGPLIADLPRFTLRPFVNPVYFAILLLEGSVFTHVAPLQEHLLVAPRSSFCSSLLNAAHQEFLKVIGNSSSKKDLKNNLKSSEQLAKAASNMYVSAARKVAFAQWSLIKL